MRGLVKSRVEFYSLPRTAARETSLAREAVEIVCSRLAQSPVSLEGVNKTVGLPRPVGSITG